MLRTARKFATKIASVLPRQIEPDTSLQARAIISCTSIHTFEPSCSSRNLFDTVKNQRQQPLMCDISKRPGQPVATKRFFSNVIYPSAEAKVGGSAPDFSAPGMDACPCVHGYGALANTRTVRKP